VYNTIYGGIHHVLVLHDAVEIIPYIAVVGHVSKGTGAVIVVLPEEETVVSSVDSSIFHAALWISIAPYFVARRMPFLCLGEQWSVPFIDLADLEVDNAILKLVPQNAARKLKALPIVKKNDKLTVAMKNPLDIFAIDEIRMMAGVDVEPAISTEEDIINAIGRLYRSDANVSEQVGAVIQEFETGDIDFTSSDGDEEEDISIDQLRELEQRYRTGPQQRRFRMPNDLSNQFGDFTVFEYNSIVFQMEMAADKLLIPALIETSIFKADGKRLNGAVKAAGNDRSDKAGVKASA
jgi:hypothetical protein